MRAPWLVVFFAAAACSNVLGFDDPTHRPDADIDAVAIPDAPPVPDAPLPDARPDAGPDLTVQAISPADASTGVDSFTTIAVTFSHAIDPATIDATSFAVTRDGGRVLAGTFSFSPDDTVVTFTPAARIRLLANVAVDLGTTIADTTGGMLVAPFHAAFAIRDGAWSTPASIESLTNDAQSSTVAVDPDGNGMAIWTQASAIRASLFTAGAWQDAGSFAVANARIGNILAVAGTFSVGWSTNGNVGWVTTYTTAWDAGASLGAALADVHLAALGDSGDLVAAGAGNGVAISAIRRIGGVWDAAAKTIETPASTINVLPPALASDGAGGAIAIWNYTNGGTIVEGHASNLHPNGTWSTPTTIATAGYANDADAMSVGAGAAVFEDPQNKIHFSLFDGVSWSASDVVGGTSADLLAVGADASGVVTAAWRDCCASTRNVYASQLAPGSSTWSVATKLSSVNVTKAPRLSAEPEGEVAVVWASNTIVSLRRFRPGVGWDPEATVYTTPTGDTLSGPASVALSESGVILVVVGYQHNGGQIMGIVFQ